ncbi:MAG TPA: radical SAM family RiPP maturation amino acid epimerase [Thermoanaerobaculia bacterium]|jgi:radical SAM family RiPP maturation amino acid epimerase|nr:radical SAM family RiPP maturation amino acid epimerase [Thermoanaerobaculia bacterium]
MTTIAYDTELNSAAAEVPISIGQAKRVLEWWSSSEQFRQIVQTDPERARREFPIDVDPELIRPLWDAFCAIATAKANLPTHPVVPEYRQWVGSKSEWRGEIKEECSPSEPRFKAWRARQISRNALENGGYDDYIIHTPLAIELTDGCSVGCWFCGVGATKVGESWRYSGDNPALWRGVLSVLSARIGSAAKWGFCYWATDPLDNPDYEQFATDFSDIVGMFPQTTTAQGYKDPERVRRLLALSEARGCRVNRFSILTEPLLRKVHETYTADELVNVEIVSQMRGSTTPKSDAGAFRNLVKDKPQLADFERKKLETVVETQKKIAAANDRELDVKVPIQPGTIACVSGFLLNMVKRTVKLISPCRANDRWPLGYIVFEEATFTDAADLDSILEQMMANHMPLTIDENDPVRLHPGLSYQKVDDGFHLVTPLNALAFLRRELVGYLQSIGEQALEGKKTAAEIAMRAHFEYGVPEINTVGTLALMFDKGVLVDARGRIGGVAAQ